MNVLFKVCLHGVRRARTEISNKTEIHRTNKHTSGHRSRVRERE